MMLKPPGERHVGYPANNTLTFQTEASNMTWDASTPKTFDRVAKYGVFDCQIATILGMIPPLRNSFDHGTKYRVRDCPVETITSTRHP